MLFLWTLLMIAWIVMWSIVFLALAVTFCVIICEGQRLWQIGLFVIGFTATLAAFLTWGDPVNDAIWQRRYVHTEEHQQQFDMGPRDKLEVYRVCYMQELTESGRFDACLASYGY